MRYFRRYKPVIRLMGMAAINGAVAGLSTHVITPDFDRKPDAILAAVCLSAAKAVLNILVENPLKPGEEWPKPQRRSKYKRR